jgi:DNA invertase Pin-like site-specific DNA recombinase
MTKLDQLRALGEAKRAGDWHEGYREGHRDAKAIQETFADKTRCPACGQSLPEPWKALGISRRTYYRKRKNRETSHGR